MTAGQESWSRSAVWDLKQLSLHPTRWMRIIAIFSGQAGRFIVGSLFIILAAVLSLGNPLIVREIVNQALPSADITLLIRLCVLMVVVGAAAQCAGVVHTQLIAVASERSLGTIRLRLFEHAQRLPLETYIREGDSSIHSRVTSEIDSLRQIVIVTGSALVSNWAAVIATMITMLVLSWQLAIATLIGISLAVTVARSTGARKHRQQELVQDISDELGTHVADNLSVDGIMLGRATGTGDTARTRFASLSAQLGEQEGMLYLIGRFRMLSIGILFSTLPALIYGVGSALVLRETIPLGTLIAFGSMQFAVMRPVMGVLNSVSQLVASRAVFSRVFELLDMPEEHRPGTGIPVAGGSADVRMNQVTYRYAEGNSLILDGLSFSACDGEFVCITGRSGAGKSTFAHLLSGEIRPLSGTVTINSVEASTVGFEPLSRVVRLVTQDTFLKATSIRENLLWGAVDTRESDLWHALALVRLDDQVRAFPDGLDTLVGRAGKALSGGQKQRLAIARAVLGRPRMLILDESTSSLDDETERIVVANLQRVFSDRCVVFVSHRAQVMRFATRVLELHEGRLHARV